MIQTGKIFLFSLLTLCVLLLLFIASDTLNFSAITASVIGSKEMKYEACIAAFAQDYKKGSFSITEGHINTDTVEDAIIRYRDKAHCGSGGCIYQLCISNESGGHTFVDFGYAAQSIQIKQTITNQMHDLVFNDEKTSKMIWDGTKYQLQETPQ